MRSTSRQTGKTWLVAIGLVLSPVITAEPAAGQYRVRVYNPSTHNNTRTTMSNRAAARAAARRAEQRRYCRNHPRAERCRGLARRR